MNFNQFKKQCFVLISISALFALRGFADTDFSTDSDSISAQGMNTSSLMQRPGGGDHGGGHGGEHGGGHAGPFHPEPGHHDGHGGGFPGHGDDHWDHGNHGYHPGYPGHGFPGEGHHFEHDPWVGHEGHYPWVHWEHPIYVRPIYDWNWPQLQVVTCTAEDSFGDLFPVTEDGYFGSVYQDRIGEIEDAALDRCYDESADRTSCRLLDCQPGY